MLSPLPEKGTLRFLQKIFLIKKLSLKIRQAILAIKSAFTKKTPAMLKKNILLFFFFLLLALNSQAQKRTLALGGKWINELSNWTYYGPGFGLQAVYKFTKHSGVESGLYYKVNRKLAFGYDPNGGLTNILARERTLVLPLLYRFESKPINVTAGFAVDYLINENYFREKTLFGSLKWNHSRSELITTISISKSFLLNKKLIIEPEIRGTTFIPAGGGGVSLNLSVRKIIF
jgi:hypothetical protein